MLTGLTYSGPTLSTEHRTARPTEQQYNVLDFTVGALLSSGVVVKLYVHVLATSSLLNVFKARSQRYYYCRDDYVLFYEPIDFPKIILFVKNAFLTASFRSHAMNASRRIQMTRTVDFYVER